MNHHQAIASLLLAASMAATRAVAATDAPPLARWGLDEQGGNQAVEQVSGRRDQVNYVFNRARFKPDSAPLWRPDTCSTAWLPPCSSSPQRASGGASAAATACVAAIEAASSRLAMVW